MLVRPITVNTGRCEKFKSVNGRQTRQLLLAPRLLKCNLTWGKRLQKDAVIFSLAIFDIFQKLYFFFSISIDPNSFIELNIFLSSPSVVEYLVCCTVQLHHLYHVYHNPYLPFPYFLFHDSSFGQLCCQHLQCCQQFRYLAYRLEAFSWREITWGGLRHHNVFWKQQ